jgi:hypothetical protein
MNGQVFESFCKASESALRMQQELFRTWTGCVPGAALARQPGVAQVQAFQKKWADAVGDLLRKQHGLLEAPFAAGLKVMEAAFGLTAARDPEEFRARLIDYGKKGCDCLHQTAVAQMQAFQAAVAKGAELAA